MLPDIEKLVSNIAEKHGLHDPNIDVKPGSKKGDGFLGDIYMVTARDADGKQLDIIVKSATDDKMVIEKFHIKEVFENEEQVYRHIFPKFKQFQCEKQLAHPFETVAKYYGSRFDGPVRLLALENLRVSGYELFDKKATVDGDHVEKVFTEYGKFHGVSFVYQHENPEDFDKLTGNLHDCWELFVNDKPFQSMLNTISKDVAAYLKETEDANLIEQFKKYENARDVFNDVCVCKDKYATLTHGDCWTNNLMFKYAKDADGKNQLKSIRILDWQVARLGSPVHDLSYFLYSSASKPVFDNLDHYLKFYYKSLSTTIKQLGNDPEVLYPFHVLKSDWIKYSRFGFLLGLLLQRMKLTYEDSIVDLHDIKSDDDDEGSSKFCRAPFDMERFKERAVNLVKHFHEIGLL